LSERCGQLSGLGIPYADDEQSLDIGELGQGVAAEMATWADRPTLRDARLLFEPGRWLAGPAGAYLCRVTRTKARAGRFIAISDGGIHHLLRPRLVGQDHRVVSAGATASRPATTLLDLVGPLCTGIDILASGVAAPEPVSGDLFAVLDAGAYGYSESMPLFLSHPTPAEVVVDDGVVRVSRERVEPA
jgi:diaminopimelate decarboxylase